jgi:hypothetical protein
MAVFFYDGPLARDVSYGDLLGNTQQFVARLTEAVDPHHYHPQLINLATDGETFGHHKKFGERTLIYAFTHEAPARGFTITNYGAYLDLAPPQWEVEIKPNTAWSCAHGLGRWSRDCGCRAARPTCPRVLPGDCQPGAPGRARLADVCRVGAGFARLGARTVSGRCARSSGDARLEGEPAAAARAATVAGAGATRSVALATQTARDDGVERVDPRPRSVQAFLDAQLARGSPQAGGLEREKDTLARLHPGRRRSTVGTFSRAGRSR